MATFVKKVSNVKYYEINGIRAAGIIPYFIEDGNVFILINKEFRDNSLVYNLIGGKVDYFDKNITETAIREFNEETGYIASDLISVKNDLNYNKLYLQKPKYMSYLINTYNDLNWKLLPYNYHNIFNNVEVFNDRDSLELKWINLFKFNEKNKSYLLSLTLYNLKKHDKFKKYDPDDEPLFIDD